MGKVRFSDFGVWRGQAPIWLGLAAVVAVSWAYLVGMGADMARMMPPVAHHSAGMAAPSLAYELIAAIAMWSVMMVAMMVPTTIQTLSMFQVMAERRDPQVSRPAMTACFVFGYVAAWTGFAILAAAVQVALSRAMLLTPMLEVTSVALSAAILVGAGLYQFSELKEACLTQCRTPLGFLLAQWRDGLSGAFSMGFAHGRYCIGCCWALMAVMLVVGAMNLLWMALLTVFMLVEKLAPARWQLSRLSGAAFVGWGLVVGAALFP